MSAMQAMMALVLKSHPPAPRAARNSWGSTGARQLPTQSVPSDRDGGEARQLPLGGGWGAEGAAATTYQLYTKCQRDCASYRQAPSQGHGQLSTHVLPAADCAATGHMVFALCCPLGAAAWQHALQLETK